MAGTRETEVRLIYGVKVALENRGMTVEKKEKKKEKIIKIKSI